MEILKWNISKEENSQKHLLICKTYGIINPLRKLKIRKQPKRVHNLYVLFFCYHKPCTNYSYVAFLVCERRPKACFMLQRVENYPQRRMRMQRKKKKEKESANFVREERRRKHESTNNNRPVFIGSER